MASKSGWAAFPHDAKGFAYAGDALKKAWPKLHAGDCEPFPDAKRAAALLKAAGKAAPKLDADARYALRRAEADLRAGVDGVRSQVEPRVQKLSGDVEARLAPIIAKLGLKPKTTRKARKPRKTATKAVRRTTRTPATRAPKKAAG